MNHPLDTEPVNNSGTGASAQLPPEVRGFSWGAFWLTWLWAIAHNTWIGLLALIPGFNFVMPFVLAFKGNEWAWQNRRWDSPEQFLKAQKRWALSGFLMFCLTSLLTVGIVAAILFPAFARAKYNARKASSRSNLKQIGLGIMQYTQDYDEMLPPMESPEIAKQAIYPYVKSDELFVSPVTKTGYLWANQLSYRSMGSLSNPAITPFIWESMPDQMGGRNVGFMDGHVKWLPEADWQATQSVLSTITEINPGGMSPNSSSQSSSQPITLTVKSAIFSREGYIGQDVDSVVVMGGKQLDIPVDFQKDYRVARWSTVVYNPTDFQINSINYSTNYFSPMGTAVSSSLGLTDGATIFQSKSFQTTIAPHSEGTIVIHDLITVAANEMMARGTGRINFTSNDSTAVSTSPSEASTAPIKQGDDQLVLPSSASPKFTQPELSDLSVGMTVYDVEGRVLGKVVAWDEHQFEDETTTGICIQLDPSAVGSDGETQIWRKASTVTQMLRIHK